MSVNHSFPTPPHILRTETMNGGFKKIFIQESGRPFHYFSEAGDTYAHDHPFGMTSHVVIGGYLEEVYTLGPNNTWKMELVERLPGTSHRIEARSIHRIVRLLDSHCLTHVEPGPPEIRWGVYDFRPDGAYHRWPEENDSQFRRVGWFTT